MRCYTLRPQDQRRSSCAAQVLSVDVLLEQHCVYLQSWYSDARTVNLRAVEPLAVKAVGPFLCMYTLGGSGACAAAFCPCRKTVDRPRQARA